MNRDVRIECVCPPTADGSVRHADGDIVVLRERLPFRDAFALRKELGLAFRDHEVSEGEAQSILAENYVLGGVETWTCEEDGPNGRPVAVAVSKGAVQRLLLTRYDAAMTVADVADDLYREEVIGPLLRAVSTISQGTSGDDSTPPTTPGSTPPEPTPLKPSSTSTTPTDSTAATSDEPAGDSKPSQRRRSAA